MAYAFSNRPNELVNTLLALMLVIANLAMAVDGSKMINPDTPDHPVHDQHVRHAININVVYGLALVIVAPLVFLLGLIIGNFCADENLFL